MFEEQCCPWRRITDHRILVTCNFSRRMKMLKEWDASWLDPFLSFACEEPTLVLAIRQDGYKSQPSPERWWPYDKWLSVLQSSLIVTNRELGCFCQTKVGTWISKAKMKNNRDQFPVVQAILWEIRGDLSNGQFVDYFIQVVII